MARRTRWKVGALLAAMMVFLTMLPATALAAEGAPSQLYVGNQQVIRGSDNATYWTTDTDGNLTQSTADQSWNVKYDPATVTLTLRGATIQGGTNTGPAPFGSGIYAQCSNGQSVTLTIKLIGENTITGYFGIYVNAEISADSNGTDASLTITGENNGSLGVSGSGYGIYVKSGTGNASLTITNASVDAKTTPGYAGVYVHSGASATSSPQLSLAVIGGTLTASGGESSDGIQFYVGSSQATGATTRLTVSDNAIVDAKNGGISAKQISNPINTDISATSSNGGIVFDGTEGTVYGNVTLDEGLTINQGETLTIPDGASLTIGDGATLTNEGTVTTTGGGTLTNNGTINNSGTLPDDIDGTAPPSITTNSPIAGGTVDMPYSATLGASGDPTSWEIAENTLPDGLTLNESTGEISGTPTADGTFNFTVKATNTGGSDSKSLSITIDAAALSITTQPSNQSVTEGQTASFSVAATGSGTLTYQWQESTDNGATWVNISGANAATYTIENTTTAMSGYQYQCVVTDGSINSVTSQAATLTVTAATVSVTGVTLNKTSLSLTVGGTVILNATITPDNATNKNVTWSSDNTSVATVDADGKVTAAGAGTATITVTTADGNKTATCVVSVTYPYVPPRPTGPDWDDVAGDISDAEPGSTVTVDMDGKTVLPGEVLDELAGSDVTLALDMGDGLIWEIYGGDVPADEEYDDVDLGVVLGGDDIPADVVNLVTGESGSVQVSLEHDGPFGFELTLVAPLGEDAAGLVANLYRFDDEAGSLGYEASAQVDNEGVARLPFDHASSWLVALDSRGHALPFPDALEGEWYSEAVRWAWLGGFMTGYGDGSGLFGTSSALTRAEAAVVLWRLAGEPEGASGLPADCDPSGFYAEAASWALGAGVFSGYSGDAFGPADAITREQLATVLWRAAGSPEAGGDLSSFSDAADVSDFADVAMRWAVSAGVLRGQGDGDALDPQGACTRAQLATMLHRLAAAE